MIYDTIFWRYLMISLKIIDKYLFCYNGAITWGEELSPYPKYDIKQNRIIRIIWIILLSKYVVRRIAISYYFIHYLLTYIIYWYVLYTQQRL